jgi:hypothetical protein
MKLLHNGVFFAKKGWYGFIEPVVVSGAAAFLTPRAVDAVADLPLREYQDLW